MRKRVASVRSNTIAARRIWGELSRFALGSLSELTARFSLSVVGGDLQLLSGRWYVTHAGLLRLASRRHCRGIETRLQPWASDPAAGRWVFRARVYKSGASKGFIGYGDADPSNVSPLVRGSELRIAETRAVNGALRKAYGIGICSVEELGALSGSCGDARTTKPQPLNGSNNGQPRLKDKLCLLIRQHNLDPTLVKAYAAHFCGTANLRDASRELVESFVAHIEKEARGNRESLLCKLNSFGNPEHVEVNS